MALNYKIHFSMVSIKYIVKTKAFLCKWSILECFNISKRAITILLQTAHVPFLCNPPSMNGTPQQVPKFLLVDYDLSLGHSQPALEGRKGLYSGGVKEMGS
jgi:hypothetical protein